MLSWQRAEQYRTRVAQDDRTGGQHVHGAAGDQSSCAEIRDRPLGAGHGRTHQRSVLPRRRTGSGGPPVAAGGVTRPAGVTTGGMNAIRDQIQDTSKRIKRLGESQGPAKSPS